MLGSLAEGKGGRAGQSGAGEGAPQGGVAFRAIPPPRLLGMGGVGARGRGQLPWEEGGQQSLRQTDPSPCSMAVPISRFWHVTLRTPDLPPPSGSSWGPQVQYQVRLNWHHTLGSPCQRTHSFKYLLSSYYEAHPAAGAWGTPGNKETQISCPAQS